MTDTRCSPDIELLPCPFCGNQPHSHADDIQHNADDPPYAGQWLIECNACPVDCNTWGASKDLAIKYWNTRASQPATPTGGEEVCTCSYCEAHRREAARSSAGSGSAAVAGDEIVLLKQFANTFRSGAQGADLDCDVAQKLAIAIDAVLRPLAPAQPLPERNSLVLIRNAVVMAIAFLGRDAGSDRSEHTTPQIIKMLSNADTEARRLLGEGVSLTSTEGNSRG